MAKRKKDYFDPVDTKIDFSEAEKVLLDKWYEEGVVEKYLKKNNSSEKYFSFLDGPITANNPMGVHHAWGRTYKDLWQRFKSMQGYKQRFQNGFDCQGLWVEVEVEKQLGLKNKKDIENLVEGDRTKSIEKFIELCKRRVRKYAGVQTEQSKRLGYFMDWDNSYFTMSDENNYMIWYFLKVCNENGWLYKGNDSVPWCPRCETAISQHEILTEDYKELTHKSVILKFPVVGRDNEFLLVWTTTPWTIPANIAIAVDVDIDYAMVKGEKGEKYWLAKESIKNVFKGKKNIEKSVKGKALVGLKYRGGFDELEAVATVAKESPELFHTVIATDTRIMPISTDEGTGLVHTAVSAGTEDFRLGKKLSLPMIPVINDDASYMEGLGPLTGKNAKENPELIFDYLKKKEDEGETWIYEIADFKHRYPVCWRCKEELVWKVTQEWYIAMDNKSKIKENKSNKTLRQSMISVAKKINWLPEFGLKRELDWLENMDDWLISKKNRYWGLALPIWECGECGSFEVIGSREELKKRAVEGWDKFEGKSPHKPQIDEVKIECSECGQVAERIEPVGNPWLDAGIVAYSTVSADNSYKLLYKRNKKQWRKWVPADFITESFPGQFKNWFYSLIAMSTVLEDIPPTINILGFATLLAEDGEAMHKSAGNMIEFNEGADKIGVDVMRWMYVTQGITDNLLFGYKRADETRRRFHLKLWNVYSFFVTYANLDGWRPKKNQKGKRIRPLNILDKWILARLDKTIKRVTEALEEFDSFTASNDIEEFVVDLSNWYIRRSRGRVGPAAQDKESKDDFYTTTYFVLTSLAGVLAPFLPFITESIYTNLTKETSVHLTDWPKAKKLSKAESNLLDDMKLARQVVELAHAQRKQKGIPVRQALNKVTVDSEQEKLPGSIIGVIEKELNVHSVDWKKGKTLKVSLDTKITQKLKDEMKVRNLIRDIQRQRKKMGLDLTQKTKVTTKWFPEKKEDIEFIKRKTSTKDLMLGDNFEVKKTSS
ncbi:MAG: isoleucine--tRNA ligase [Candidatus Woesebacteria bacterium]|jgi:isoleucyl-tRNA synthetase